MVRERVSPRRWDARQTLTCPQTALRLSGVTEVEPLRGSEEGCDAGSPVQGSGFRVNGSWFMVKGCGGLAQAESQSELKELKEGLRGTDSCWAWRFAVGSIRL